MTENLLEKLEEKMMMLLSEVEDLRKDVSRLNQENHALKSEKENSGRKLQDLISLLDSVSGAVENKVANINAAISQPIFGHEAIAARE